MDVLDVAQLAEGPTEACFVDLTGAASEQQLADALAAASRAQVPVVGIHPGPLPSRWDSLSSALTLTLVEAETVSSTIAVSDLSAARDKIRSQVTGSPTAAAVLVGLLRLTSAVEVPDGLVAESLAYSMLLGGPEFAAWRAATPRREAGPDPEPVVRLEREHDVLTVALHRPRRHNAFSRAMRDALIEALLLAELDPALRVRLCGDGPSFCSGGDLDEFGLAQDLAAAHLVRIGQSAGASVHRLRDRVTAQLHGACIGAGVEVPAFAHRVEADPDTRFQLPELRMGLVPGAGGTVSLPRRIGRWRTAYLALSGAAVDARTGRRWGLVDHLC